MFPGLFIQPSVWLRTNSHPPRILLSPSRSTQPTQHQFSASFKGSHLKWHRKAYSVIGEEHNVVCVK